VRDAARRGGGLDLIVLLETLQPVPEAYAAAEQDRDDDNVHVVDEPGGKEVKRRAALHLDRRARVVGEDEDRRVKRRVGAPPALPLRVLVPSGRAELPGTHDLGADPRIVQPDKGVVDAAGAAGLTEPLAPPPRGEHPFVQPLAGMAERCVEAQTFAGTEAVERDGKELDAGE